MHAAGKKRCVSVKLLKLSKGLLVGAVALVTICIRDGFKARK